MRFATQKTHAGHALQNPQADPIAAACASDDARKALAVIIAAPGALGQAISLLE
jgi:hypothetical protein